MSDVYYFDILPNDKCSVEGRFSLLPKEIKKYIISLTKNKIYDLCLINKYFDENCKIIRIVENYRYLKLTDLNIKTLINITYLRLFMNELITDQGIKNLINLKSLSLFGDN